MILSERASQEDQNGANFSFVAPSSESYECVNNTTRVQLSSHLNDVYIVLSCEVVACTSQYKADLREGA